MPIRGLRRLQEPTNISPVHNGEVVLELETELEPGPLIVVVLARLRSKLQDFCDVRRHHVTAALPLRKFSLASVTRLTTSGDQRDDFKKNICANDLRLEMAHLSQCGSSVYMRDKPRTENMRVRMHRNALGLLSQAHHSHTLISPK